MRLDELCIGDKFIYSNREFIKLGFEQIGILAVATKPLHDLCFDSYGRNNWRQSSLREYLNNDFIKNEIDPTDLLPFVSDLITYDGTRKYGECVDYIFLLSADLYEKYKDYLPGWDRWMWLITAQNYLPEKRGNAGIVCTDGSLTFFDAMHGYGTAIACSFKPSAMVTKI